MTKWAAITERKLRVQTDTSEEYMMAYPDRSTRTALKNLFIVTWDLKASIKSVWLGWWLITWSDRTDIEVSFRPWGE